MRVVALALGLDLYGSKLQCWIDGGHKASLDVRRNRVKCFRCPSQSLSTVDLVMAVHDFSIRQAIQWLDERFPGVPRVLQRISTNTYGITKYKCVDYVKLKPPASHEISLERFVRSPGWCQMPHAARSLAAKLLTIIPRDTLWITTSYPELKKRTGIKASGTLSQALRELEGIDMIQRFLTPTGNETRVGFATRQTVVKLTWLSPLFQSFLRWGYAGGDARWGRDTRATGYTVQKLNYVEST